MIEKAGSINKFLLKLKKNVSAFAKAIICRKYLGILTLRDM